MSKTVPFQTIQFIISTQFKLKYTVYLSKTFLFQAIQFSQTVLNQTIQFSISMQLVQFNPQIGPYPVLPFGVKADLGAMKGCSTFPKAPTSLEPHHQIVQCHIQDSHCVCEGRGQLSAEMQSVYSTDPAEWIIFANGVIYFWNKLPNLIKKKKKKKNLRGHF